MYICTVPQEIFKCYRYMFMLYGTNQLQLKRDTRAFLCERVCLCVSHVATSVSFIAILLLQTYGHYPPTLCFRTLSAIHLRMLNGAETR